MQTPSHTTGPGGTVVPYGDAAAPRKVDLYLDPRCPYCKRVEDTLGDTFRAAADAGTHRLAYHFGVFLDQGVVGGSHHAVAALGAAVDEGQDRYADYLKALYGAQPGEETDAFADPEFLLSLAEQVPGLRTDAFEGKVRSGGYLGWVDRVEEAFEASGVQGTPTVLLDGRPLGVLGRDGQAVPPDTLRAELSAAGR